MSAQLVRADYKPRQTLRDRHALMVAKKAATEFMNTEKASKDIPSKSKSWYFWLGWMSGAPFWILSSAVIFALVLNWTSPDGIAR